jgi:hypothetical protein
MGLGVATGGGYDEVDRTRVMKSLIQLLLEISQDKMYLKMFVLKLTDQSLPYVLMSSKLAVRILALPEGIHKSLYIYIKIHIRY